MTASWAGIVRHRENLGSDLFLHVEADGGGPRIVARGVPEIADTVPPGARVVLRPRPGRALLFDRAGRRIVCSAMTATALPLAAERSRRRSGQARAEAIAAYLSERAGILCLFGILLLPTLATFVLSFTDCQLGAPTLRWIGLDNYAHLATDRVFWNSLSNTVIYVVGRGARIGRARSRRGAADRGRHVRRAPSIAPPISCR